jgi:hypothetical protein
LVVGIGTKPRVVIGGSVVFGFVAQTGAFLVVAGVFATNGLFVVYVGFFHAGTAGFCAANETNGFLVVRTGMLDGGRFTKGFFCHHDEGFLPPPISLTGLLMLA